MISAARLAATIVSPAATCALLAVFPFCEANADQDYILCQAMLKTEESKPGFYGNECIWWVGAAVLPDALHVPSSWGPAGLVDGP